MKGKQAAAAAARRAAEAGDRVSQLEAQIAGLKAQAWTAEQEHRAERASWQKNTAATARDLAREMFDRELELRVADRVRTEVASTAEERALRVAEIITASMSPDLSGVRKGRTIFLAEIAEALGVPHMAGRMGAILGHDVPLASSRQARRRTAAEMRKDHVFTTSGQKLPAGTTPPEGFR